MRTLDEAIAQGVPEAFWRFVSDACGVHTEGFCMVEGNAVPEPAKQPAQVAGVDTERGGDGGRRGPLAMGHLVHHPHLGQRERRVQVPLVEQAEAASVEPVEPADPRGGGAGHGSGTGWHRTPPESDPPAFVR